MLQLQAEKGAKGGGWEFLKVFLWFQHVYVVRLPDVFALDPSIRSPRFLMDNGGLIVHHVCSQIIESFS